MTGTFSKLIQNDDGATAIKYSLIAAFIAVAALIGTNVIALVNLVASDL